MNDRYPTLLCAEEEKNTYFTFKQILQKKGYSFFTSAIKPKDALDTSQNNTESKI